jgi:hypothetical protein
MDGKKVHAHSLIIPADPTLSRTNGFELADKVLIANLDLSRKIRDELAMQLKVYNLNLCIHNLRNLYEQRFLLSIHFRENIKEI